MANFHRRQVVELQNKRNRYKRKGEGGGGAFVSRVRGVGNDRESYKGVCQEADGVRAPRASGRIPEGGKSGSCSKAL